MVPSFRGRDVSRVVLGPVELEVHLIDWLGPPATTRPPVGLGDSASSSDRFPERVSHTWKGWLFQLASRAVPSHVVRVATAFVSASSPPCRHQRSGSIR